jgi:hypothetical protein
MVAQAFFVDVPIRQEGGDERRVETPEFIHWVDAVVVGRCGIIIRSPVSPASIGGLPLRASTCSAESAKWLAPHKPLLDFA